MIDREFRRQQLNELRAAIGRIPPFKTPRKGFTPKQRQAVSDAYEGRCAGCDERLQAGWQVDHIKEIAEGGAHEPRNWQPLCGQNQNGCHAGKTAAYLTRKAKADRNWQRETEGPPEPQIHSRNEWPQGRTLQSRPFGNRRPA